jgi:lipid-A-disaccharide synthase-like uncharacterized protein
MSWGHLVILVLAAVFSCRAVVGLLAMPCRRAADLPMRVIATALLLVMLLLAYQLGRW